MAAVDISYFTLTLTPVERGVILVRAPLGSVEAEPVDISIIPTTASISVAGQMQFTAVMLYTDATYRVVPAQWTLASDLVASIGLHTGTATGIAIGTVEVTAIPDGMPAFHAHAWLTVVEAAVEVNPVSLSVVPASASITAGETTQFTAVMLYSDSTSRVVPAEWAVASDTVASIGLSTGIATGLSFGIVEVTVVPVGMPSFHAHASLTVVNSVPPVPTPPIITNVIPAPGTPIVVLEHISLDVLDDNGLRAVLFSASFSGILGEELIYNGSEFKYPYLTSSVEQLPNGLRFHIVRSGGWPGDPTITPFAFDVLGAEG